MSLAIEPLQPSTIGRMNERQILRLLQSAGPMSRADVTRRSGISAPTVSKAVASLLAAGLLEEFDAAEPLRGRPAKQLRLAQQSAQVLGFVIDQPQCRVVSASLDGRIHDDCCRSFDTPDAYVELIAAAAAAARELISDGKATTLGLGICMPGLIDARDERGILSPNVPCTNGQSPSRDLGRRLGMQCVTVHESHALCLAERYYGAARDLEDFAMFDISTGVGLGVMSGGRILAGHSGLAGEIGHVTIVPDGRKCGCGNRGCLETVASDSAFAANVSRRLRRKLTADQIVQLVRAGKLDVRAEAAEACRYLAIGLAAAINLFNPATLFVHGRLLETDEKLFGRLVEQTKARALAPSMADCRIVQARGSKRQGAVAGILQHLTNSLAPTLN
jgi:N-acetylglucosamine repressor